MMTKEQLLIIAKSKNFMILMSSLFSAFASAAAATAVANKRFEEKYKAVAEQDIEEAKEFYKDFYGRMYKTSEETATPEQVVEDRHGREAAVRAITDYQGVSTPKPAAKVIDNLELHSISIDEEVGPGGGEIVSVTEVEQKVVNPSARVKNVFADRPPWDYEEELLRRAQNPDEPYVISEEEFLANEPENEQEDLTYFSGDDILVDSRSDVIPDADGIVGDNNLSRFGDGSGDKNTVYVRNDLRAMDFAITYSDGKYTEEVLGYNLSHADDDRKIRKFRRHHE